MGYTFELIQADDGEAIRCRICGRISHHPNDVREAYCGACHRFLRDDEQEAEYYLTAAIRKMRPDLDALEVAQIVRSFLAALSPAA